MERTAADVIDKAAGVKGEKHSADSGPDGLLQYPWPVHDAKKSEIREEFATLKKAIADKRCGTDELLHVLLGGACHCLQSA